MNRSIIFISFLIFLSCSSRKSDQIGSSIADSKSKALSDSTNEYSIFDFYNKFASKKDFQLTRIKNPLHIDTYGKNSIVFKEDWVHDSLFIKLDYITHIYDSFDKEFEWDEDPGNKAAISWMSPLKREKKDYYFIKEDGKWFLSQIVTTRLSSKDSDSFLPFLVKFMTDSIFQVSRVRFPIKLKAYSESDEEFADNDTTLELSESNWRNISINDGLRHLTNFTNSWNTDIKEGIQKKIYLSGVDNGIYVNYYFEKDNGKWFLVNLEDFSD